MTGSHRASSFKHSILTFFNAHEWCGRGGKFCVDFPPFWQKQRGTSLQGEGFRKLYLQLQFDLNWQAQGDHIFVAILTGPEDWKHSDASSVFWHVWLLCWELVGKSFDGQWNQLEYSYPWHSSRIDTLVRIVHTCWRQYSSIFQSSERVYFPFSRRKQMVLYRIPKGLAQISVDIGASWVLRNQV